MLKCGTIFPNIFMRKSSESRFKLSGLYASLGMQDNLVQMKMVSEPAISLTCNVGIILQSVKGTKASDKHEKRNYVLQTSVVDVKGLTFGKIHVDTKISGEKPQISFKTGTFKTNRLFTCDVYCIFSTKN